MRQVKLDFSVIMGSALILIGSVLASANLIFVNLPQILIILSLFLILPGALTLYVRDLRAFQKLTREEKKKQEK